MSYPEFTTASNESGNRKLSFGLKAVIGCLGGGGVLITAICLPFVTPAFRKFKLPFVPATPEQISNILTGLKKVKAKGPLLDIGSGDGRIVVSASKCGFKSVGIELNPWLVLYSKISTLNNSNARFIRGNLWKHNLSQYNSVVVFGIEEMMPELEVKVNKEIKTEGVVAACRFPFPNLEPLVIIGEGIDTVWIYKKTSSELGKK